MKLTKSGSNIGALCKIEVVDSTLVQADSVVTNGTAVTPPVLVSGAEWEELYFTEDSAHFVERRVDQHFQLRVVWRVPKDSAASIRYLLAIAKRRFVAKITDLNGTVRIVGTKAEPCVIRHEMRDLGQNARDSNHYNMALQLTRAEPAAILL